MNRPDTRQTQPPAMRLMMACVFSPILIVLLAACYGFLFHSHFDGTEIFLGYSIKFPLIITLGLIPLSAFVLMLWKGCWRVSLLLIAASLGSMIGIGFHIDKLSEDRRIIKIPELWFSNSGTRVYCNGVLLGELPLDITVGELKAKVPQWTEPPEQKWFVRHHYPLYTWYPWDAFTRERYDEYQSLFLADRSPLEADMKSRYWWRFEADGMDCCVGGRRYLFSQGEFDDIKIYHDLVNAGIYAPAEKAIVDLFFACVDDLDEKEKRLCAEYVGKMPGGFHHTFDRHFVDDRKPFEELLTLAAKMKYEISDTPTRGDCLRLLEQFRDTSLFTYYPESQNSLITGDSTLRTPGGILPAYAIKLMGESAREPVRTLLRKHWYHVANDGDNAVLLDAANRLKSPELFDDLVRYYATTKNTFNAVVENNHEQAIPMFWTIVNSKSVFEWLPSDEGRIGKLQAYARLLGYMDNEKLEPHIREYLADGLSQIKEKYVTDSHEKVLATFIEARTFRRSVDRGELKDWVDSLNIPMNVKQNINIRYFRQVASASSRIKIDFPEGEHVIFFNGSEAVTTKMLCDWLREHPDQKIEDYFYENDPAIEGVNLKSITLSKLIEDESLEAGVLLKRYWNDPLEQSQLLSILRSRFSPHERILAISDDAMPYLWDRGAVRLPGFYYDVAPGEAPLSWSWPADRKINPAVVEIFHDIEDPGLCYDFLRAASNAQAEGLPELIEKWSRSDNKRLQDLAKNSQDAVRMQDRIKNNSKPLLMDLVTCRIKPDDLLPKSAPWVWSDGKYVKKEEN